MTSASVWTPEIVTRNINMPLDEEENWNAEFRRITNLAEGIDDNDATNVAQTRKLVIQSVKNVGNTIFFDTLAEAEAATLVEGDVVDILSTGDRYRYESGVLVFKYNVLDRQYFNGTQAADTISDPENFSLVATDGTALRTLLSYVSEGLNAYDFSAVGNAIADDTQALLDMGAAIGWISLARGSYKITSTNIDYPIYFHPGASLYVDVGDSVVIRNRIHSPVQYIFQGDGEYLINVESGGETGEDARVVHAGWFGVFPSNLAGIDVTTKFQRCLNAFAGQTREGIIDTGQGSFHFNGPMTVPRGVWIRGAGTRRTIFDITGDGYTVFTTEDDACRFTGFQFEYPAGTLESRNSAFIRLAHNNCETDGLWLWSSRFGIIVEGKGCSLRNTEATYGMEIASGGAMILVRGSNTYIEGVRQTSSITGPTALVDIGAGATETVSNVTVKDLQSVCPAIPVQIRATTVDVDTVTVDGVNCKVSSGTVEALVKILAQGDVSLRGINLTNLLSGGGVQNLVSIANVGTGAVQYITMDAINSSVTSGTGIKIAQTDGIIGNISVGSGCNIAHLDTPIDLSGTIGNLKLPAGLVPDNNSAQCYSFTLADDTAVQIPANRTIFSGSAIITGASNQTAVLFIRVAPSPNVEIIAGGTNITPHDYALSGTTGTDGTLNVGVSQAFLYIENRTGGTIPVSFSIFSGS